MASQWMSPEEIADELGVPLRSVYSWRAKGTGPIGYKIGRHVRVKRDDLDAWIALQVDDPRRAVA